MRRAVVIAGSVAGTAVLLFVGWRFTHRAAAANTPWAEPTWPPLPRRITVEVLNGGGTPGEARDAALRLRRGGLDVVAWGNAPESLRDTTSATVRVLLRTGDTAGTGRIAEVLGSADVRDAPDPTRLVDLTVVVPRDDED